MHRLLCFVLVLGSLAPSLWAQSDWLATETEAVTVYSQGAQVTRSARWDLPAGESEVILAGLSPWLDENSLQVDLPQGTEIMAMNFSVRYPEQSPQDREKAAALNQALRALLDTVREKEALLTVYAQEEQVLINNTDYDIWPQINAEQLAKSVQLFRQRLTFLKRRRIALKREIEAINRERQKKVNALQALRIQAGKPQGTLALKLNGKKATPAKAELSYTVADAGWTPFYDLRVSDLVSPLQIDYRAEVYQNTGEDWEEVALSLSTGNPYQEGSLPDLPAWYLNYSNYRYGPQSNRQAPRRQGYSGVFQGLITDAKTGESLPFANVVARDQDGRLVAGTSSAVDGSFRLESRSPIVRLEVSMVGYQKQSLALSSDNQYVRMALQESSETLEEVVVMDDDLGIRNNRKRNQVHFIDGVKVRGSVELPQAAISSDAMSSDGSQSISRNPVNFVFVVPQKADIPSDGQGYKVKVSTYEAEVEYRYQAVPKRQKNAYLTARLAEWEKFNLLPGRAGIYLEGRYLGETQLDPETAGDTLALSLGRDENLVVQRNTMVDRREKKAFGRKVERQFHYEIVLRNNRSYPFTIEIIDQYPVSVREEIEVKRDAAAGAELEEETGLLRWELDLEPGEERKLNLRYRVLYPRGQRINL